MTWSADDWGTEEEVCAARERERERGDKIIRLLYSFVGALCRDGIFIRNKNFLSAVDSGFSSVAPSRKRLLLDGGGGGDCLRLGADESETRQQRPITEIKARKLANDARGERRERTIPEQSVARVRYNYRRYFKSNYPLERIQ